MGDYAKVLEKLPKDELLTPVLINNYIRNIELDTKTRKRVRIVLRALSQFANCEIYRHWVKDEVYQRNYE